MSLIEPANGDVTLLVALIGNAHDRITDLLRDAGRNASNGGARDQVAAQLRHDVDIHLQTVHQVLGSELTEQEREQLRGDARMLRDAIEGWDESGIEWLRALVAAFAHHVDLEEHTILKDVAARSDPRRLATLGFAYTTVADTHLD